MDEELYNFVDFIERVKDMDYQDIMNYGDREVAKMKSTSCLNPGAEDNINRKDKIFRANKGIFIIHEPRH